MRIACLDPAATEIVCALGLAEHLVGISHGSDWPPEAIGTPVVTRAPGRRGGPGTIDANALAAARPDLIISRRESQPTTPAGRARRVGTGEPVAEVGGSAPADEGTDTEAESIPTLVLDPRSIEGIFNSIVSVGAMTASEDAALDLVESLREQLGEIEEQVHVRREDGHLPPRIVALEGTHPLTGSGRWIPEQVRRAGAWDLLGRDGEAPEQTTWEAIREVDPEMLVLVSDGERLGQIVREWVAAELPAFWPRLEAVRRKQVFAVEADWYFTRPGPRVIDGIALLAEIFDPDGFVETSPPGSWTPIA